MRIVASYIDKKMMQGYLLNIVTNIYFKMKSKRGGKREGAGRPRGEPTKVIRIPESKVDAVMRVLSDEKAHQIPLYSSHVRAGFPSPADDYIEDMLDLNNYLIKHPASTFIVKVSGDSMKDAGINSGSLLLVDRSIEPVSGKIVVAALNGELTVKRLSVTQGKVLLIAENPDYPSIEITEELEMVVWGVVTSMIQEFD